MAIVIYPTMHGVVPTFGDCDKFAGVSTPFIYYNTETKESRDANGNPVQSQDLEGKDKGVPMAGVVDTTLPKDNWKGAIIRE